MIDARTRFGFARRFDPSAPEMIDMPDADPALLRDELKNLRIINRYFGGCAPLRRGLLSLGAELEPGPAVTMLDLGTGSGDQAVEAVRIFRTMGRTAAVTAVDNNAVVLEEARTFTAGYPEITVERADIRSLPYGDAQFDIVLCSLTAHHLSDPELRSLLREMRRLARVGFLLVDLRRSWAAMAAAWLYTRATTTNIMTKTDAIASIRAAFTKDELLAAARGAGLSAAGVRSEPFFRLSLLYRAKDGGPAAP